jgi:uncharacterized RDD family membrane protein YckC
VTPSSRPAGLALVLAAAVYDGLLTVAILFIATALALTLTAGEAIPPDTPLFQAYLLAAGFPYFGWCWSRAGQTLGMRAWHLRLQREDGAPPSLADALLRYLGALLSWLALGLGFLWLLAPGRRSWHDRLSRTRVLRESPRR